MSELRRTNMPRSESRAAQKIAAFGIAALSPALLFAVGCGAYDELRCTHGIDWNTCQCLGAVARPPAAAASQAAQDLRSRAARDNRFIRPINGSSGESLSWSPEWELRWLDFQWVNNRQVRIYHATAKANRSRRFTTYYDPDGGRWIGWQPM